MAGKKLTKRFDNKISISDPSAHKNLNSKLLAQSTGKFNIPGGFIEYLLDRLAENCKETKEVIYRIIRRLSKSEAFDTNTILKMKKYVEEGPFFTEAGTEVAIEGEE